MTWAALTKSWRLLQYLVAGIGLLNYLLEVERRLKHERSLAWYHLLVNRVVQVRNLTVENFQVSFLTFVSKALKRIYVESTR